MRAIRVHQFGDPSVLRLEETPTPEPGPGQVQVEFGRADGGGAEAGPMLDRGRAGNGGGQDGH